MSKEPGSLHSILVPIALWLAGIVLTFYPSIFSGFRITEHDAIDSRMNNYILEHGWRWFLGDPLHRSFWDPPFFFPSKNAAAYTDVLLGAAPFYWAWRALGLAPDTAFSFWAFTLATLNFLAFFWFLRGIAGMERLAAAGGAFVFAFSSCRTVQLQHIQLYQHFFTVAAIVAIARLFGRHGPTAHEPAWIGVFVASVVSQFYASYYLGWFFGFSLLLATLWSVAFRDTRARLLDLLRRRWLALGVAGALAGLALWPLASHYLEAARAVGFRPYVSEDSPLLYSWIYMNPGSVPYGWMSSIEPFRSMPGLHHEHWLGFGLVTSALAVVGLWRQRASPGVRLVAITGLGIVLLSSRLPLGLDPWQAIRAIVPGANALRAPSRLGLMLLIPGALGFALWLNARRTVLAAAAAMAVMVGEQLQSVEGFNRMEIRNAAAVSVLGVRPADCAAFLYAPADASADLPDKIELDAMFGQLESGVPTLNGYSGNFPPRWPFSNPRTETPADRAQLRAQIADWARLTGLREEGICVTTGRR